MRVAFFGEHDIDGVFSDDQFAECLASIIEDKDDHCGQRSLIDGTSIKSIVVTGLHAPSSLDDWAAIRGLTIDRFRDNSGFYAGVADVIGFLDAGDCVITFFRDEDDARAAAVRASAKKARRRTYEFACTKERGWGLIDRTPPVTGMLF